MDEPEYDRGTNLKPTPAGLGHNSRLRSTSIGTFIRKNQHGDLGIVVNGRNKVEYFAPKFWEFDRENN